MQCLRRCAVALVATGATLAVLLAAVAYSATDWLAAEDPRGPADAIVVLGHDPTRVFQAADVFREGHAPQVVLSRPRRSPRNQLLAANGVAFPWFEEVGQKILVDRGVPADAVSIISTEVTSTWTEANAFGALLPSAKRLIVVTSPYHVFRTRIIFRRALPDREIRVIASRYEPFPRQWWRDQEIAIPVIMEFIKLPFFLIGGRASHDAR